MFKLQGINSTEEAIVASRLDWHISEQPVEVGGVPQSRWKGLRREDTGETISIVSKDYQVLQNRAAFRSIDPLVQSGEIKLLEAGEIGNSRILLKALIGESVIGDGTDPLQHLALFRFGHDGGCSVNLSYAVRRNVCLNQTPLLQGIKGSFERAFAIAHRGALVERVDEAKFAILHARDLFSQTVEVYDRLAKVALNDEQAEEYVNRVFPLPEGENRTERTVNRAYQIHEKVRNLRQYGRGARLKSAAGTLWGAFNAVTEFVDHVAAGSGRIKNAEGYRLFGDGLRTKGRALEIATSYLGSN